MPGCGVRPPPTLCTEFTFSFHVVQLQNFRDDDDDDDDNDVG